MIHLELIPQNNNIQSAILTATITSILGVIILAVQKSIEHIYLIPINKQKETIEVIAVDLIKYANLYANPFAFDTLPSDSSMRRDFEIASNKIRELSALLSVKTNNINNYSFWYALGLIKVKKEKVLDASGKLMALSNSFGNVGRGIQNSELSDEIKKLLAI